MASFGFGGGIMGKLKSVNINKVFNLGMTLWGIEIGTSAAINAVGQIAARNNGRIGGIQVGVVNNLILLGTTIARATVLTKFIKNMPFGNYLAPVITIGTAAVVVPQALSVMMSLANINVATDQIPRDVSQTPFLQVQPVQSLWGV